MPDKKSSLLRFEFVELHRPHGVHESTIFVWYGSQRVT